MSHVYKVYPTQIEALSDVNLEISDGEFTYIYGASSSGRTTLIRILYGAEKPTRGEVIVNGMDITAKGFNKIHLLRRSMGIVFQDFKLLRDRTVSENISFALEVIAYQKKEIRKRVSEVLEKVGLHQRAKDPILALSAGEQQRVAIARALVNNPPLILADEPTENLDDQMADEVMRIFTDLNQKGTTIILATHNKELIQRYPYRVIYLLGGRVDLKTKGEQKEGE